MPRYFKANNYNDRWQNDDPEKALAEYNEIWKLAPNYVQSKFLVGLVYAKLVNYFKQVAFELKEIFFTKDVLDDIEAHPDYQFIATGHSLGGAVATIFLYEAINKGYLDPNRNEPVLITYGQPRTGNENFVLDYTKDSPFPLVRSSEELFEKMKNLKSYDYAPQIDFKNKYLTFCDGKSGKKV